MLPKGAVPSVPDWARLSELIFTRLYATCPRCHGQRFNDETLEVTWKGYTVADIWRCRSLKPSRFLPTTTPCCALWRHLTAIGLATSRANATELSGGEAQRVKLATELQRITNNHTLYILDEPSAGLHPADVARLNAQLHRLVDHGHTVIVVEHDQSIIASADHVIDMGPGAGRDGGKIIAATTPAQLAQTPDSITGHYLATEAAVTESV